MNVREVIKLIEEDGWYLAECVSLKEIGAVIVSSTINQVRFSHSCRETL